jgi:hypothetical protein
MLPYTMPASTTIYAGAMVMVNSAGAAVPAAIAATNNGVVGIAKKKVVTVAGETTTTIAVERGQFRIPMTGLTVANLGDVAYAKDDNTVGASATNEPPVGEILGIDGAFAWVMVGSDSTAENP